MKSSQSNFNLRSPSSYLARSYVIATVTKIESSLDYTVALVSSGSSTFEKSWEQSKFYINILAK